MAALLLVAWFYEPYAFDGPVWCLWRRFFDIECFGCGMTRAVCSLAHGRIFEATQLNPLVWLVFTPPALILLRPLWIRTGGSRFRRI